MSDTIVKGNKRLTSGTSEFNAQEFMIRNAILGLVNTAIPVIVTDVFPDLKGIFESHKSIGIIAVFKVQYTSV